MKDGHRPGFAERDWIGTSVFKTGALFSSAEGSLSNFPTDTIPYLIFAIIAVFEASWSTF